MATKSKKSSHVQVATYKGRNYRCLFVGNTKYGYRAHLQFFDGSKDFWCDGSLVSVSHTEGDDSSRSSYRDVNDRCCECGGELVDARHHRAMGGYCGNCAFDEFDC